MIKHTVLTAFLLSTTAYAHAGFWDFLFGGDEQAADTAAPAPAAEAAAGGSLVKQGMALLPLLSQTLNISDTQATGGLGALLKAAQSLMSGADFSTLASAIPNADKLLALAPTLAQNAGAPASVMDSALNAAAEHSGTVKAASQLVGQFKELGLGPEMIPKFTAATNTYLQENNKTAASDLLMQSLGSLF